MYKKYWLIIKFTTYPLSIKQTYKKNLKLNIKIRSNFKFSKNRQFTTKKVSSTFSCALAS